MGTYIINTNRGERRVSRRKAITHAARAYRKTDISRAFQAPRSEKASAVGAAERIYDLRHAPVIMHGSLDSRLKSRLAAITDHEISKRHLTEPAGWDTYQHIVTDRRPGLWVIHGEGWYKYSKRAGSWMTAGSYLAGKDDGQYFAVRIPATITSVSGALDFLTPFAIRKARERGIPTVRQGDIYFRPVRGIGDHDMRELAGTRHEARARKDGGLSIVHPQHKCKVLSAKYKWRAYRSTQVHGHSAD